MNTLSYLLCLPHTPGISQTAGPPGLSHPLSPSPDSPRRALFGVFYSFWNKIVGRHFPRHSRSSPDSLLNARPDALKGQNICGGGNEGGGKGNVGMGAWRGGMRDTRGPARRGPAMAAALRAGSCLETAGPRHGGGKGLRLRGERGRPRHGL